jgi:hypothetical protein
MHIEVEVELRFDDELPSAWLRRPDAHDVAMAVRGMGGANDG